MQGGSGLPQNRAKETSSRGGLGWNTWPHFGMKRASECTLFFFLHPVLEYPFLSFSNDVKSQPTVWTGNASDQSNDVQAGCLQCRIQYGIYIYIISTLAKIAKFHSSRCKIGKPGAATVTSCYFEAEEWPRKPLKCRVLPNEQNSAEKVSNRSQ